MGKIIAIGGWKIWQPRLEGGFFPVETTLIDKEIVSQSQNKNPKFLFLPSASWDAEVYIEYARKHFEGLWCKFDVLLLCNNPPSPEEIRNKILSSDIVYVWGGNTLKMMNLWKKLWVDQILKEAHAKWIILSGLSAGAICWFRYGNSDSRQFTSNTTQLIRVSGLWLIPALICPHYDTESIRQIDLPRMMRTTHGLVAIALDDCAALEVVDDTYRLIVSKPTARWYRMYWRDGSFVKEEILQKEWFESLTELLHKPRS